MRPFFPAPPTLETSRLRLRAYRLDDFARSSAMFRDPAVYPFLGGVPVPRGESWRKFVFQTGHWSLLGYGWWVMADKETDLYLGEIGFADFKRDMEPRLPEGTPEMGWTLVSEAHGKGIATEAGKAALEWHDRVLRFPVVGCAIAPENAISRKLAAKLGFRELGESTFRDKPILRLERVTGAAPDRR